MQTPRFSKEVLEGFLEHLNDPNLIGVAFFLKEEGQVVCLGDIVQTGIATQGDTLWEVVEGFDMICRMQDVDIAKEFGDEVVRLQKSDDDIMAKTAAAGTLHTALVALGIPVIEIRDTPTSLAVILPESYNEYDGPWEWDGFSVHAERVTT